MATSGIDALGQLEVEIPDLVLAIPPLVRWDGFAPVRALRQRPEVCTVMFILILDGITRRRSCGRCSLGDGLSPGRCFERGAIGWSCCWNPTSAAVPRAVTDDEHGRVCRCVSTALPTCCKTMELGRKSAVAYCVSGRGQRDSYFADGAGGRCRARPTLRHRGPTLS